MFDTLGLYGLGRLGSTLALAMLDAGLPLRGVTSYHPRTPENLHPNLRSLWKENFDELIQSCELVFLTVRDDALLSLVSLLAEMRKDWTGHAFIHTCGAQGLEVFQPLTNKGAATGVFHPLNSFPEAPTDIRILAGTHFGLNTEHEIMRTRLEELVQAFHGHTIRLDDNIQPLYHLIAVLVANAPIVLAQLGYRLLQDSSQTRAIPWAAYAPLIQTAMERMKYIPPIQSLTGPWARKDQMTMNLHLNVLQNHEKLWKELYQILAQLARQFIDEEEGKVQDHKIKPRNQD